MKYKVISLLLCTALLYSCESGKQKEHSAAFSDEEEEVVSEGTVSTEESESSKVDIDRDDLSEESSQAVQSIDKMEEGIKEINSPDKLIEYEAEYDKKLSETYASIERAKDPSERKRLQAYLNEIQHNYNSKKNEYSMPANGIIQNIENLTQRLESCKSKNEFMQILDPRISYFNNLPKLHTIVAEPNRRQEVREKAEQLNVLFQKKKAQFDVVY